MYIDLVFCTSILYILRIRTRTQSSGVAALDIKSSLNRGDFFLPIYIFLTYYDMAKMKSDDLLFYRHWSIEGFAPWFLYEYTK